MKRSSSPSALARAVAILLVIACCCSLLPRPCSAVCKDLLFLRCLEFLFAPVTAGSREVFMGGAKLRWMAGPVASKGEVEGRAGWRGGAYFICLCDAAVQMFILYVYGMILIPNKAVVQRLECGHVLLYCSCNTAAAQPSNVFTSSVAVVVLHHLLKLGVF